MKAHWVYCTISINSAVTHHRASGYGRNPLLALGHRGSGQCQKTIVTKSKIKFFSSPTGSFQLSELNCYESEFTRIRSYKHLGPQIDHERFNGVLSKL